ncbi:MAG: phospho-N-acetylmuramoyl-pentapeptide-transferase [Saprospiraceae bacterium]|jgi:phospho-N-acetylmuramoyl-pentapeptide-transferase|nr:phospho-N-acetylmuramoyl-pentapeptide-transferase [Saprospiraceae bacterium]MBK7796973.1 phospho-N-acetylmuramoyl-pentapeptide-transferase [Saprospiraceae bacterium]MBK9377554.1 phospho-N-acetylmuramoyl-pentapeptide-transferase [Saprospiraceae bacterium]MBL0259635.1 phospho-N-acetylmuramoyl-pentapeptide-transferase [Saprospiraceae bacterium]
MLYYLFQFTEKIFHLPGGRLFQYITFRALLALIISLVISMLFGGRVIGLLKKLQIGETVRDLGLSGQKEKEGTPTMGGVIIIMAIVIPTLLLTRLDNVYILLMLFATLWMGLIGFADDYIKVFLKDKAGLKAIFKISGQFVLGLVIAIVMLYHDDVLVRMPKSEALRYNYPIEQTISIADPGKEKLTEFVYVKTALTNVPFLKGNRFDYTWVINFMGDNSGTFIWMIYIPLMIFIVTAVSNAANLTDGLDGLATGISAIIAATLAILAYVSGNTIVADYLNIFYLPFSGELVIFSAAFLGACIGFLWYNSYPAKVFMGDTGSLTLGGIIATLAILLRKELLIPLLCGAFFVETLSVVIQVAYFKYTKRRTGEGKRIFLMSPIHHHFQKKGVHEAHIAVRFWIVTIFLAALTIITLKIR